MKYFSFILLLLCPFLSFGQDPQLFKNTWYLEDLILNDVSNPAPSNSDLEFISLDFFDTTNGHFRSDSCSVLEGDLTYDNPNSTFTFLLFGATDIGCDDPDNQDYDALYVEFYDSDQDFPFVYEITSDSGVLSLTITSQSGDKAVYSNQFLSIIDNSIRDVAVYPNPVINEVNLKLAVPEDLFVSFFDVVGREVKSVKVKSSNVNMSVNLDDLASGPYFLKITSLTGSVIRQVVKM